MVTKSIETKTVKGKAHLLCRLTDTEVKNAAKALADGLKKREEIESRLEALKQQMKAEATQVEGEISFNRQLVSSESEFRTVEIDIVYNFTKGTKEFIRTDTGEVYKRDGITDDERQQLLPLE
jgi:hypothetical protein